VICTIRKLELELSSREYEVGREYSSVGEEMEKERRKEEGCVWITNVKVSRKDMY
jgi:hypothetical protein